MAQIGLNISISGLAGKLIIRWVKASSPLAESGRSIAYNFPVDLVYNIANIAPVVYIVQLWRSNDGVALDQLIKDWAIDASKETTTSITTYQYVVDRGWNNITQGTGTEVWADPSDEDAILLDERLDGFTQDQLIVHEAGYGNKINSEYSLYAGGGIELLDNKEFATTGRWFITVAKTTMVTLPVVNSAKYEGVETLTADRDIYTDPSVNLYNKLCIAGFAGTHGKITFQDFSLIPDGTHVTFQTHSGNQNYLTFQFNVGNTVKFCNRLLNTIHLARCEKIDLYFSGGICYVTDYDGGFTERGSVFIDYDQNRDADCGNLLFADESTGILNKVDYEGAYEFIAQLSGNSVCNLGSAVGQWSYSLSGVFVNKQKFGIDTGTQTFRVPHLSNITSKMGSNPGSYEAPQVGEIRQDITFKQGKSDDNESGVSGEYLRKLGAGGGTNYGTTVMEFLFNSGQENKVKSVIQKPYIVL